MKKLIWIAILLLIPIGCTRQDHIMRPSQPPPKVIVQSKADGEYVSVTLPCRCGDFLAYVQKSCPCFDREQYPDLANTLENVYAWAQTHNNGGGKKVVGKYELLTLQCGCVLQVYVPGSSGCLEKQSPDLAVLLRAIYSKAKSHENK